eukprot:TRINITY_DN11321_c0_g1_i1.p1 TRINITY_DN11321_c0_g1~~TRINITY_DN11321_c0_g1_i1.p1  ORF type:complete len:860 (+),score=191.58 TRINITY_DN11321_c0_g1_i1:45-2582(+)
MPLSTASGKTRTGMLHKSPLRTGMEKSCAYGLPPMRPAHVVSSFDNLQGNTLLWKIIKMGTGRLMLGVHTETETIQLRQLTPSRMRQWAKMGDGRVLSYCRATLGGTPKTRGWLGVGSGVVFFIGDGDVAVDILLSPSSIVELVRDDELCTIDVRYNNLKPRAAVFAVHKQRLSSVINALVQVCDETRALETTPSDFEGADSPAPPPPSHFSQTSPTPPDLGRNLSPERLPSSLLIPSTLTPAATTPSSTGYWAQAPTPIKPRSEYGPLENHQLRLLKCGLEDSNGCNTYKWSEGGVRMGGGYGDEHLATLQNMCNEVIHTAAHGAMTFVDELINHLRFPHGATSSEVIRIQGASLYEKVPKVSLTHSPLETVMLRMFSQEGPDIDRLLGYPDTPLPTQDSSWEQYDELNRGKRNVALYSALAEACCSGIDALRNGLSLSQDIISGYCNLLCYLLAAAEPQPPNPLFRPALVDLQILARLKRLVPGMLYGWAAPAPCTLDEAVARGHLPPSGGHGQYSNVLFIITGSVVGLPIHSISQYPSEMEVLLPPFVMFQVIDVAEHDGCLVVRIEVRGSVADGNEAVLRDILKGVKIDDVTLQSRPEFALADKQEQEERRLVAESEDAERKALRKAFYLSDLQLEAAMELSTGSKSPPQPPPAIYTPSVAHPPSPSSPRVDTHVRHSTPPHKVYGNSSPPAVVTPLPAPVPPKASLSPAPTSIYTPPASPGSMASPEGIPALSPTHTSAQPETTTLRNAAKMIRTQAERIKTLEWQLQGLQKVLEESHQPELIAKVEQLNQQRSALIADRKKTVEQEVAAVKHKMLMVCRLLFYLTTSGDTQRGCEGDAC